MATTANMGLTKPVKATDLADVNVLNTNSDLIDAHDHTGGKGAQISGTGIADGSITNQKLATGIDGGKISGAVAEASHALAADRADTARMADDSLMVDGCHAGTAPLNVLKLDGSGRIPVGTMPAGTTLGLKELWIWINGGGGGLSNNNIAQQGQKWTYTAANYPTPLTVRAKYTVSCNVPMRGGLYCWTTSSWVDVVTLAANASQSVDKTVVLTTGREYSYATEGMEPSGQYVGGNAVAAAGNLILTW